MAPTTCPLCGVEYDENGVCDVRCMARVTAEDDQARAEAYAAMDTEPNRELNERERDLLTLILYRAQLRRDRRPGLD